MFDNLDYLDNASPSPLKPILNDDLSAVTDSKHKIDQSFSDGGYQEVVVGNTSKKMQPPEKYKSSNSYYRRRIKPFNSINKVL